MARFANPLAPRTNRLQAKSLEIKNWVRDVMDLDPDTPVTVAELACRDEGCPDIETVIGILEPGKPIRTARIHGPMAKVKRQMVAEALSASFNGDG